ncbi:MAG: glycosyltransferase family 39 protein [Chloroflexota bacterium]|nr:glycosyltransferase family 39 protein [Chloroflexota bacterium]
MNKFSPENRARVGLILLVLTAFAWRVQGLTNQSLWRDEVDAIYFALRDLPATLAMLINPGQNGPLYFLALRPWFMLVGASEFGLRFPSVLAGTVSVPLCWAVTRQLLGTTDDRPQTTDASAVGEENSPSTKDSAPVPLLAAAFLALNPYQLWYGQEGKMYAVIVALMLLAHWVWLRGMQRGGWHTWLAYLMTVSLAMYTHLLMVLLIPLHLIWFLLAWPQSRRAWVGYGLALAGLTLPYLPMVWWQWRLLVSSQPLTGFTFTPLPQVLRTVLLSHSRGFLPSDDLVRLLPLFFLALAGLVLGWTEIETRPVQAGWAAWRRFLWLLSWLIVPVLGIYTLSLRQAVFTERYIIWIAPAAMICLALGAKVVWHNAGPLAKPLTTILVVYVLSFWLYAGWQQKTQPMKYDLRSAVTYIAARRQPQTLLILQIPHMEYSYRYYSSDFSADWLTDSPARLGRWVAGLWTNGGAADAQARSEVDAQMQQMTAGAQEVWVMRSEVEMWDARHLMDEWLEQHGTVVDRAEFHGAQVKQYRLR